MVGYGKRTLRNGAGGTSNLVLPHQLAGEQVWEGDRQCSNAGRWSFARMDSAHARKCLRSMP
jgi:hypothetical protein